MTDYSVTVTGADHDEFVAWINEFNRLRPGLCRFALQSPQYSHNLSFPLTDASVTNDWRGLANLTALSTPVVFHTVKPLFFENYTAYVGAECSNSRHMQKTKVVPTRDYVYPVSEVCAEGCGFEEYVQRCEDLNGTYVDGTGCACLQHLHAVDLYFNLTSFNFSSVVPTYSCLKPRPARVEFRVQYALDPYKRVSDFISAKGLRWEYQDTGAKTKEIVFYVLSAVMVLLCVAVLAAQRVVLAVTGAERPAPQETPREREMHADSASVSTDGATSPDISSLSDEEPTTPKATVTSPKDMPSAGPSSDEHAPLAEEAAYTPPSLTDSSTPTEE